MSGRAEARPRRNALCWTQLFRCPEEQVAFGAREDGGNGADVRGPPEPRATRCGHCLVEDRLYGLVSRNPAKLRLAVVGYGRVGVLEGPGAFAADCGGLPRDQPGGESLEKPHQFVTLDALRGVAAIAVMSYHSTPILRHQPFLRGELAVDFFFMLSGFVLTFAYGNRLDAGWGTGAFLKTRLARLYPLYALGLVLGGSFLLAVAPRAQRGTTALAFAAGLVVCPSPWTFPGGMPWIFPLNFPTWSLFYEAVANVVHALFLRRRSAALVGSLVVVAGGLLVRPRLRKGLLGDTQTSCFRLRWFLLWSGCGWGGGFDRWARRGWWGRSWWWRWRAGCPSGMWRCMTC